VLIEPTLRKEEHMSLTAKRTGLLALAVTFSAGIHAALAPEHLKEMPPLGYAFIVAAAIGAVLAWALVSRPSDRRIPLLAGLFCLGQIVMWALFVTTSVPGFAGTPEPVETIALVSKAAELLGVALALQLIAPRRHAARPRSSAV
jgi:4-amino-4-deoxy-L-arabinose transferase-like glycosyltransferase